MRNLCGEFATFPKTSANYYASPLVANGVLYAIREDGVVFVARTEEDLRSLLRTTWENG